MEIAIPEPWMVDHPIGALVSGCTPGAPVTLTATACFDGSARAASATFVADRRGVVDPALHASVAGSYTGIDPFGLWWSADPEGAAPHAPAPPAPIPSRLQVESGAESVSAEFERHWLSAGATVSGVHAPGVNGVFARPAGTGPFPGVVAFGGSGGGLGPSAGWAPVLASHGFATLAIAYFGAAGLPSDLVEIEIEVVERAARWLLDRADVLGSGVAVMGMSRGSEIALWSGVLLDTVNAVVAFSPSGIGWSGLNAAGPVDRPAWTFRGEPIPYAAIGDAARLRLDIAPSNAPLALRGAFDAVLEHPAAYQPAVIPVERIGGPVLCVSGEADAMWPATEMTEVSVQRARQHGFPHEFTHLRYPDAGHTGAGVPGVPVVTAIPRHPLTGAAYSFGGTRSASARARADSWPQVLTFLRDAATT